MVNQSQNQIDLLSLSKSKPKTIWWASLWALKREHSHNNFKMPCSCSVPCIEWRKARNRLGLVAPTPPEYLGSKPSRINVLHLSNVSSVPISRFWTFKPQVRATLGKWHLMVLNCDSDSFPRDLWKSVSLAKRFFSLPDRMCSACIALPLICTTGCAGCRAAISCSKGGASIAAGASGDSFISNYRPTPSSKNQSILRLHTHTHALHYKHAHRIRMCFLCGGWSIGQGYCMGWRWWLFPN